MKRENKDGKGKEVKGKRARFGFVHICVQTLGIMDLSLIWQVVRAFIQQQEKPIFKRQTNFQLDPTRPIPPNELNATIENTLVHRFSAA